MIFIIGGSDQGKLDYALENYHLTKSDVFTCTEETREVDPDKTIIEHIERFALGCVRRGEEPREYWDKMNLENRILIADDVSCGVVPMDAVLRAWREATGRANNALAARAERVIRVFCGLGQVIK